jgi:cytochrome P450
MAADQTSDLDDAFTGVSDHYRGTLEDPHPVYKKFRAENPVYAGNFMAEMGVPSIAGPAANRPTFTLFKHADTMRVMRDAKTFTSGFIAEGLGAFLDGLILTGMDGLDHKKARALLAPAFTPSAINAWRGDRIDRVIREEFVAPLAAAGKRADLMEMGLAFPVRVIYALIGLPENQPEMIQQFASWALHILAGPQVDPDKAAAARAKAGLAIKGLYDAMLPVVQQRRAEGAIGSDLISHLLRLDDEGQKLTDHEVVTFVRSLLPAAAETTTRTFGTLMTYLLENPAVLETIRADRSLVPKAIDEAVRIEPTATFKVRQASQEVEIRGVTIPEGAMVSCIVSSANRDEDVFENADVFDPFRPAKPSFGFGFGTHMCIGLFVAKAEIEAALNAILDLMPNVRLDPDKPAPKITGLQLRGPHQVHVIWD